MLKEKFVLPRHPPIEMTLEDLLKKITQGEWSVPHFALNNPTCQCGYVLCDHSMGSIAEINKAEGQDESYHPPIEEAKANAIYIIFATRILPTVVKDLQRITLGMEGRHKSGLRPNEIAGGGQSKYDYDLAQELLNKVKNVRLERP